MLKKLLITATLLISTVVLLSLSSNAEPFPLWVFKSAKIQTQPERDVQVGASKLLYFGDNVAIKQSGGQAGHADSGLAWTALAAYYTSNDSAKFSTATIGSILSIGIRTEPLTGTSGHGMSVVDTTNHGVIVNYTKPGVAVTISSYYHGDASTSSIHIEKYDGEYGEIVTQSYQSWMYNELDTGEWAEFDVSPHSGYFRFMGDLNGVAPNFVMQVHHIYNDDGSYGYPLLGALNFYDDIVIDASFKHYYWYSDTLGSANNPAIYQSGGSLGFKHASGTWGVFGAGTIDAIGDAAAAGSIDLENYTLQILNAGVEHYKFDSTGGFYAKGGFSSGVADGQRVMNASNTIDVGATCNQGDYYSVNDIPKFSKAGGAGIELYHVGGTDVPVADGGTGASTAAAARANIEVPSAMFSVVISDNAITAKIYPFGQEDVNVTATSIECHTDTGTVIVDVQEGSSTSWTGGTNMSASPITCDANGATATTISNATLAANAFIAARLGTEAGTPTVLWIKVPYTVD